MLHHVRLCSIEGPCKCIMTCVARIHVARGDDLGDLADEVAGPGTNVSGAV